MRWRRGGVSEKKGNYTRCLGEPEITCGVQEEGFSISTCVPFYFHAAGSGGIQFLDTYIARAGVISIVHRQVF